MCGRFKLNILIISLTLLTVISITLAWIPLAQIGLNESYNVKHLSTHFSRVFLCITVKSSIFPTLIEAQWPGSYLPTRTLIFPYRELHANGNHTDCSLIHQAHWSQVDSLSRLWILDLGWNDQLTICGPKLLVFDLVKNNAEVLRIDCSRYIQPKDTRLLTIKLSPKLSPCHVEKFIYFILKDDPHILAYDILEQKWHQRVLLSQKYNSLTETFPIKPVDLTFGLQKELLVSDEDGSLYSSIDLLTFKQNNSINMELYGNLLGPSKGMMVDYVGALFYVVPKFGAVIRCKYKKNLTAEDNEIIYMTSKNIQQIFFGSEGSVWLLTNRTLKPHDHCFPGLQ